MKSFAHIASFLVLAFGHIPVTVAHNRVPIEEDTCVVRLGRMSMHFTAYQVGSGTEYCWDLPAPGKNILVFDFLEPKMRSLQTEVAVIETGSGDPASEHVVTRREPQTYPAGTLSLEADFENGKNYYAKLVLSDAKPITLKAPLHVGLPRENRGLYIGGAAGVILMLGGAAFFLQKRNARA